MTTKSIFISWERHRRTRSIAARFGLTLFEIAAVGPRWRRYWSQVIQTFRCLNFQQPSTVIVQCPSIVLTVIVLLWKRVARANCKIVIDAHNEAIEPMIHPWLAPAYAWCVKRADYTIVTNRFLCPKVRAMGGRALVLTDPLPRLEPTHSRPLSDDEPMRVLVIATYEADEPIREIKDAAWNHLGQVEFRFTGNHRKCPEQIRVSAPSNVKFTGYLSDFQYWRVLNDCHAVMDLTLMDNCLVCGGYEAVAMGRPMILSATRALREQFQAAAIYTACDFRDISAAVKRLRINYAGLCDRVIHLRKQMEFGWNLQAQEVAAKIFRRMDEEESIEEETLHQTYSEICRSNREK